MHEFSDIRVFLKDERMTARKLYQVREFADMAGVSVRTLQYYDRIGILAPSDKTDSQHRLYARRDLLKLQQIMTLKQLGFTLKEIKQMIQHPDYDLRSALEAQKQAVDVQIEQLKGVSSAMENALQILDETDNWDWDTVQFIIQGMKDKRYLDWIRRYYSEEQLATLAQQSQDIPLEDIQRAFKKWQSIAEGIRQNRHLSPDHSILQAFAQQSHDLIHAFTQGDVDIHNAVDRMYSQPDDIPPAYKVFEDDLLPLYRQVMDVFYQNH
jgi:MerR family transcriptional regulator, thiopeptide resistance regulator